eukprot:ANDGO_02032.mRNA.1 hypothetical protein
MFGGSNPKAVDTRQRAYRTLDTCAADGAWVEEPQFNRRSMNPKTLVGNWQEARVASENEPVSAITMAFQSTTAVRNKEDAENLRVRLPKPNQAAQFALGPGGKMVPLFVDPGDGNMNKRESLITAGSTSNLVGGDGRFRGESTYRSDMLSKEKMEEIESKKQRSVRQAFLEKKWQMEAQKQVQEEAKEKEKESFVGKTRGRKLGEGVQQDVEGLYFEQPASFYTQHMGLTNVYGSRAQAAGASFAKCSTFSMPIEEYKAGYEKE